VTGIVTQDPTGKKAGRSPHKDKKKGGERGCLREHGEERRVKGWKENHFQCCRTGEREIKGEVLAR